MGLKQKFAKIRDYFTEEADEPEVKKEVIQVPIPAPEQKEEKPEPLFEEAKVDQKTGPIYFDDKDFEDLPISLPPKPKKKEIYIEPKKEEKKSYFRPSPIISPVYGVLDKNYYKEDISEKRPVRATTYDTNKTLTIDDVRNKAYGTLEDDLVNNLINLDMPKNDEAIINEGDIFEEMVDNKKSDELPDVTIEHTKIAINNKEEEIEKLLDNTMTEDDLFELVDAMYDRKDEEDGTN